jgi:glucosamine--fructose-6-phosphate aminotransferase (isomerizing)
LNFLTDKSLKEIINFLIKGLKKLEYRGYDSCGIGFDLVHSEIRKQVLIKSKGSVTNLQAILEEILPKVEVSFKTHIAIGHTRWATHGSPTATNAHPHISSPNFAFIVVHNGIISNYTALKTFLIQQTGFISVNLEHKTNDDNPNSIIYQTDDNDIRFYSETDTEVLPKLAYFVYLKLNRESHEKPTFLSVIANTMKLIEGTFGCLFKSSLYPNEVIGCRVGSPIVLGLKYDQHEIKNHSARYINLKPDLIENFHISLAGNPKPREIFLSSDPTAFIDETQNGLILEEWDIVHISENGVTIINTNPSPLLDKRLVETLAMSVQDIDKGNYPHFMFKEIMEQPQSLMSTLKGRLHDGRVNLGGLIPYLSTLRRAKYFLFIGCGTSYHAALAIRPLFEQFCEQRIQLEIASDFNDRKPVIFRDDVCFFISQSGETADTLIALNYCKKNGAFCIGINNSPGSSLSRNTECGVHLNAGVEIGVASSKAYTSTIEVLILILLLLMQDSIKFTEERNIACNDLINLSQVVEKVLKKAHEIQTIAKALYQRRAFYILGRKTHFATAKETALKLSELTYIHSEGFLAGELKHGPIALIDEESFIIFFATGEDPDIFTSTLSSLQQVKSRGAKILIIASEDDVKDLSPISDNIFTIPKTSPWTQMIVNIIPMQLLAYYIAIEKNLNVDRPRNLAKSVTV